jgi:hypothetical protein
LAFTLNNDECRPLLSLGSNDPGEDANLVTSSARDPAAWAAGLMRVNRIWRGPESGGACGQIARIGRIRI